MGTQTTIEVNGKRYDAVTGSILGAASAPPVRTGRNIDGFFRSRTTITPTLKNQLATPPSSDNITVLAPPAPGPRPPKQPNRTVNHAKAHMPQVARTIAVREKSVGHRTQKLTVHRTPAAPNHAKAHAAQHSQTLMRAAVQRPKPSFHKQAGTQASLQHAVPSLIVPKKSVASVDADRLVRAQSTIRSPFVARHGAAAQPILPTLLPLAVQPVPVKPEGNVPSTAPAPQAPNSKPDNIFEHAIANATNFVDTQAHKQHFRKQTRHHVASMAAGTLALLIIAGFAAYQNTPGLQLRVASFQAGVATNMPNFKAAGFAYDGVKADNGKLTVGFTGQNGTYQLVQTTTNLSGSDMIQNVGATDASGAPIYTTVHAGDTTVYRFNNTDATWVNSGKWYTVTGTKALTDQQVKSLVQNV